MFRKAGKWFLNSLTRRKRLQTSTETSLNRCLSTFDLTALGIGSTLGLGIYVLAGEVASRTAGPAVVLSFFIAAVASVFAGLCYAEFGARVPRAGSAYVYSYVTTGELMAFIIGWNLILEYVIGTASVARGYSGYLDSLVNGTIQTHFRDAMPINLAGLSEYPDFLAFGITLLLTVILAIGVQESTRFNSVFTCLNLALVVFIIVCGALNADVHNWKLTEEEVPEPHGGKGGHGYGGFFAFGFSGMMAGAATCFYGFVGFDCIATTGEEARNPKKAIPISIVVSLFIIFLAYFGVSTVQTMIWPYYDQTQEKTAGAPLPFVFDQIGWIWAKWIISIGALTGLSTSLLGAMFPLPRVLYAMATDGLIFRFLAKVHPRFKTPFIATVASGILAGIMAAMFDISALADMMSIGTLLAYTLVAVSVLILRYEIEEKPLTIPYTFNSFSENLREYIIQLFNARQLKSPTPVSSHLAKLLVSGIAALLIAMESLLVYYESDLQKGRTGPVVAVATLFAIIILMMLSLWRQPTSSKPLSFQVPCVPLIPVLSMFVNIYLMLKLNNMTWIRFAVWMVIGFLIYFGYGIRNSSLRSGHIVSVAQFDGTKKEPKVEMVKRDS